MSISELIAKLPPEDQREFLDTAPELADEVATLNFAATDKLTDTQMLEAIRIKGKPVIDQHGTVYVTDAVGNINLELGEGEAWINSLLLSLTGSFPSSTKVKAAIGVIRNSSSLLTVKTNRRTALHEGIYYIDIGDATGDAYAISSKGWEIVQNPPVSFLRAKRAASMPRATEGNFDLLWKYANIAPKDRLLVSTWMLECFRPDTPYPILEIIGAAGVGKSSAVAFIRRLIDPVEGGLTSLPAKEEDMVIQARNNLLLAYDNVSNLSQPVQDLLCKICTGAAHTTRTLYTNTEETVITLSNPVMVNGIADLANRADLVSRVVRVEVETPETRLTMAELNKGFEVDLPSIMAGMLDLLCGSLAKLEGIKGAPEARLVDFINLGQAVAEYQDNPAAQFVDAFDKMMGGSQAAVIDGCPAAEAVIKYFNRLENNESETLDNSSGSVMKTVYTSLGTYSIYKTSRKFKDDLLRAKSELLEYHDIEVEYRSIRKGVNHLRITKVGHSMGHVAIEAVANALAIIRSADAHTAAEAIAAWEDGVPGVTRRKRHNNPQLLAIQPRIKENQKRAKVEEIEESLTTHHIPTAP